MFSETLRPQSVRTLYKLNDREPVTTNYMLQSIFNFKIE